jgi:hypothetical protein
MTRHPRFDTPLDVIIDPVPSQGPVLSELGSCKSSSGSGVRISRGVPHVRGDAEKENWMPKVSIEPAV